MPETMGKVRHIAGARYFYNPTLGRVIIRKSGVNRKSAKVEERNKAFKAWVSGKDGAVVKCRGKIWKDFVKCLKDSAAAANLGTGKSKTKEYRQKFWRIQE